MQSICAKFHVCRGFGGTVIRQSIRHCYFGFYNYYNTEITNISLIPAVALMNYVLLYYLFLVLQNLY